MKSIHAVSGAWKMVVITPVLRSSASMLMEGTLPVWIDFWYTSFPVRPSVDHVTGMVVVGSEGLPICSPDIGLVTGLATTGEAAIGNVATGSADCEMSMEQADIRNTRAAASRYRRFKGMEIIPTFRKLSFNVAMKKPVMASS